MYGRICVDHRLHKSEPNRTRLTVGGNLINYPGEKYTPTADISTAKILFNSVISSKNAKFMSLDLKDFYLMTPMPDHEYMWLPYDIIPDEIKKEYNLNELVHNERIYAEI